MSTLKKHLCLATALLLAGCGGGSSSSDGGVVASDSDSQDCQQSSQCTIEMEEGGKIDISVPEGGLVASASGEHDCAESSNCVVEVADSGFFETFTARPAAGYLFTGWLHEERGLCGGSLEPCTLGDPEIETSPGVADIIESEDAFSLTPQFLPEREIRRYLPGDTVQFGGTVSGLDTPPMDGEIDVNAGLEILSLDAERGEFPLLAARLTVSDPERDLFNWQVQFWQDAWGAFFELTDENGNTLLDIAANSEGIASIPAPLQPQAESEVPFSAMWGGHTSTPLTSGNRSIRTGEPTVVSVPAGEFIAYPVTVIDEYSYTVSFADYKRGQTVVRERVMWVSQAKGVVGLQLSQSLYSDAGKLLSTFELSLEAVEASF